MAKRNENETIDLVENKRPWKKGTENEPENEAQHFVENKGMVKEQTEHEPNLSQTRRVNKHVQIERIAMKESETAAGSAGGRVQGRSYMAQASWRQSRVGGLSCGDVPAFDAAATSRSWQKVK